jgi:7-cyano-7-deazaguanine reductase
MATKEFDFTKKIEDMSPADLKKRIKAGYEFKIPHKLVMIPFLGSKELVTYTYPELIALCPATGYPDTYTLIINFIPNKVVPELKSLKFYLMDYINLPISHEHLCDKIYKEFKLNVKPLKLQVILNTAVRGGIYTDIIKGDKL